MDQIVHSVHIHDQVAAILRQAIRSGRYRPGEKLERIRDLARRFDVSIFAISQALLELSKEGLIQRRHAKGIYVLDWKKNRQIGILCELDVSHPHVSRFFPRVIQQLRRFFRAKGWEVKVYIGDHQPGSPRSEEPCPDFVADVKAHQLGGVIILTASSRAQWLPRLKKDRVPIVAIPPWSNHGITIDIAAMVREGTGYLLSKGRRRLAVMGWSGPDQKWEGEEAFRCLLQENGVEACGDWIRHDLHPSQLGAGWDEFREIWTARAEKPDGLLICDDMLLRDVALAILNFQIKVPDQLMIVSHANKRSGILAPFPVAHLEYDPDEYAQAAGDLLLKLLNGEKIPEQTIPLPFRWVENSDLDDGMVVGRHNPDESEISGNRCAKKRRFAEVPTSISP